MKGDGSLKWFHFLTANKLTGILETQVLSRIYKLFNLTRGFELQVVDNCKADGRALAEHILATSPPPQVLRNKNSNMLVLTACSEEFYV